MAGVSFDRAVAALPAFCIALMQNLPSEDIEGLGTEVLQLRNDATLEPQVKSLNLGLLLTRYVGDEVLRMAVESLGDLIRDEGGE